MEVFTVAPERAVTTSASRGSTVSATSGSTEEVILIGGGSDSLASRLNETLLSVLTSKLPSTAMLMALVAVLITQPRVSMSEQLVMRTDDGGLMLEFSAQNHDRELLYAIPEDGEANAIFFVAHDGTERLAGTVSNPKGLVGLASWLAGDVFPVDRVTIG